MVRTLPVAIKSHKGASGKRPNVRLHHSATMVGFRRSLKTCMPHTSLLALDNVNNSKDASFYLGKRVCYVHKGVNKTADGVRSTIHNRKSRTRTSWGRITKVHGNSGVVRAKFATNLPTHAVGRKVRVYLFPSSI